jgi:hypothetical protein
MLSKNERGCRFPHNTVAKGEAVLYTEALMTSAVPETYTPSAGVFF